jgi:CubicO group peptidase (beta-lactamase class C family)
LAVEQGKISLDEKVTHYIPSFYAKHSPSVSQQMTVRDFISHCSDLTPLPYYAIGKNDSVFARREDVIQICNNLPYEPEFRSELKYNNWMFALAGVLIQQESQRTFGQLVKHEVLKPLGMPRTATKNP